MTLQKVDDLRRVERAIVLDLIEHVESNTEGPGLAVTFSDIDEAVIDAALEALTEAEVIREDDKLIYPVRALLHLSKLGLIGV